MGKHAPSASKTRAFLFSPNPNKGMLTPLFYAASRLHSDKELGIQGREECLPSPGAKNKNLSLSLFAWFSMELISATLIRYSDTVLVSVASCKRKGRRGKEGVEKNKQPNNCFHLQPSQERYFYMYIYFLFHQCWYLDTADSAANYYSTKNDPCVCNYNPLTFQVFHPPCTQQVQCTKIWSAAALNKRRWSHSSGGNIILCYLSPCEEHLVCMCMCVRVCAGVRLHGAWVCVSASMRPITAHSS